MSNEFRAPLVKEISCFAEQSKGRMWVSHRNSLRNWVSFPQPKGPSHPHTSPWWLQMAWQLKKTEMAQFQFPPLQVVLLVLQLWAGRTPVLDSSLLGPISLSPISCSFSHLPVQLSLPSGPSPLRSVKSVLVHSKAIFPFLKTTVFPFLKAAFCH